MNVLFATSEAYPLAKTGGLGDVSGQLPRSLQAQGARIRLITPGYRGVLDNVSKTTVIADLLIDDYAIEIHESTLPGSRVKVWVVVCPELYDRDGGPYQDASGDDWPDNAQRFAIFDKAVCEIAQGRTGITWPVDIVHCHDWQTGLIPALLKQEPQYPATLFTIHNLAYQGLFPYQTFLDLGLPDAYWSHEALEFHGQMSFMKGGLVFADRINTVSPHYAEEIKSREFGCGLEGLLQHRASALTGILNGIDPREWNPSTDPHLKATYTKRSLSDKALNKQPLQYLFDLPQDPDCLVVSMVSRLTHQKGVDVIVDALAELLDLPLQLMILGTGDRRLEQGLQSAASAHPTRLGVKIAYNESWAHLLIGGSDAFMMPSRFEPCGLTQLYSLRYGTVPIVRNVGGLADTVIDATPKSLNQAMATGVIIDDDTPAALVTAIKKVIALYQDKPVWQKLQLNGMRQEFSWAASAREYLQLYRELI
ncbi:MAG TPA: glycogen synthase GlgA [Gammaproteobacteria bacterium]